MSRAAGALPRKVLTDRGVKSAGPGMHWDALVPQFGLRVYDNGRKSWIILYRRNRRKIGSYPKTALSVARDRARVMLGEADAGRDPFAAQVSHTVESAADLYIAQHVEINNSPKWSHELQRILRVDILPWIGDRPLDGVSRREVGEFLGAAAKRGKSVPLRLKRVLSGLYSWCVDRELCEVNPTTRLRVDRPPSRKRVLTAEEIRTAWHGLMQKGSIVARAALLSLPTARRQSECLSLRWEWRDGHWWTIPEEFAKGNDDIRFYMTPLARGILPPVRESGYVFSQGRKGNPPNKNQLGKLVRSIRGDADWTNRDFRRTAATLMRSEGVDRHTVSMVLAHSDASVTAVYDRYEDDPEKREAMILLAWRLRSIIAGSAPASRRRSRAPNSRRRR